MTELLKIITELQNTPIPVILVTAGIVFLFLALSGGISGKIQIPQARHKWAGALGAVMLLSGLILSIPGVFQDIEQFNGDNTGGGTSELLEEKLVHGTNEDSSQISEGLQQKETLTQDQARENQLRHEEEVRRQEAERERQAREEALKQRELEQARNEQLRREEMRQQEEERERQAREEALRQKELEQARQEQLRREEAMRRLEAERNRQAAIEERKRQLAVLNVDLYVSEFELLPAVPVQKQPMQVRIGIYNQGNKASGPLRVEWWAGKNFPKPERVWHIKTIAARGGRVLTHNYAGYKSWYSRLTTRVVIDPSNTSRDSSPENNVFETTIQVRKP